MKRASLVDAELNRAILHGACLRQAEMRGAVTHGAKGLEAALQA